MQGSIELKAGRYHLEKSVWMHVQQNDRGVSLSLYHPLANLRYEVLVDETGVVVSGAVKPFATDIDQEPEERQPSSAGWEEVVPSSLAINKRWREATADPLKCFPSFAKHKFTLRHGPSAREHRQGWPIAGYEGDGGIYILYRRPRYRGEFLLRISENGRVVLNDDNDPNRMPTGDWPRFLHLAPRKHFSLNFQDWQKMTQADLAAAVGGQIFEVWGIENRRC